MSNYRRALAFHLRIGDAPPARPTRPGAATVALRLRLLREEAAEAFEALQALPDAADAEAALAAAAHELADLLYVTYGTFVALGVDADAAYAEVHRANLRKAGAPRRRDGKQLRPPGFQPADLAGELAGQARNAAQGEMIAALRGRDAADGDEDGDDEDGDRVD